MLISVLVLTYNHERFVRECLDSALSQTGAFDLEIVVGDDFSRDGTTSILREYESRFGNVFVSYNAENVGLNRNLIDTFRRCRGKYIAILEGDDYWCSTEKLAAQVDLMERDASCVLCSHDIDIVDEKGSFVRRAGVDSGVVEYFGLDDLLKGNFIRNCSVLYRNNIVTTIPDWFYSMPTGDWPLHSFHAVRGRIVHLHRVLAAYRLHPNALYSTKSAEFDLRCGEAFYANMTSWVPKDYHKNVRIGRISNCYSLIAYYCNSGQRGLARRYIRKLSKEVPDGAMLIALSKSILRYIGLFAVVQRLRRSPILREN